MFVRQQGRRGMGVSSIASVDLVVLKEIVVEPCIGGFYFVEVKHKLHLLFSCS